MTLGAAASNPASKGPRRPPVFITLFSAHAADPSPGRLARWQRCPLYGAERHAASLRPAAPAGCTVAPAVPEMHADAGRGAGHRNSRPGCDALPNAALAPGPAADPKKYEESQQQRRRVRLRARVRLCKLRMRLCFFAVASLIRHCSGLGKQPNTSLRAPERRSPSLQAGRSESARLRAKSSTDPGR
jgi:hypothetical protein